MKAKNGVHLYSPHQRYLISHMKKTISIGECSLHTDTHTLTHTHTLSRTGRFVAEDFVVVNESTKVGSNGAYVTAVGEPAVKGT